MKKPIKLILFILLTIFTVAFVSAAKCWDYEGNEAACENSSDSLSCIWYDAGQAWCPYDSSGCCEKLGCWYYDGNKTGCQAAPSSMGCAWDSNENNQNSWCPVSPSDPYDNKGDQVSGTDIGCCGEPGCWDMDGQGQAACENASFMNGKCLWKTQEEDPYCPNSAGCCMMPFCEDVSTQEDCDFLADQGQPCNWDGSSCSDSGFGGYSGADSCVDAGGFWNGTNCEMPTWDQEVHCWFADFKENICKNISGCVYCNSSNILDDMSACYNNEIGWCQGHEKAWANEGAAGTVNDIATDAMECSDIKLKKICDCGPLPGCHWTNSSAITGNYCQSGVSQCDIDYESKTYDKCKDAPNQSECNVLINNYFMPCIFNLSGTEKCEFDWQSGGGFGDEKSNSEFNFEEIKSQTSCEAAGGIWKIVEIDAYGNTDSWCEFGFGQNTEKCDESCWACEYQDDGSQWTSSEAAQAACESSAAGGGNCQFTSFSSQVEDGKWGWCDFPQEMQFFGGGNCDDSCYDCFNSDMCTNSEANCTWVNDPMGFGPGWCDPADVAAFMTCSNNPLACIGQQECENNGYNWTNQYVNDPFDNEPIWVCIENGTSPEVCFVPGDEDNDNQSDCADSDCANDPMCGFGMGDTGSEGGMMLPPEMEEILCFDFDDTNQSACEAKILNYNFTFNGTHRGVIGLPEHMNNTQVCYYHEAHSNDIEDYLCDPIYEQQMSGGMQMGKPPTPIGNDPSGDSGGLDYLDIVHIGIMDEPQTMALGIPILDISAFAVCNNKLQGTANGTIYRYIDSDINESTGCTATNGTYDGFDYKLVVKSTYNGSDINTITSAFRCIDSTNNIWTAKSATLTLIDDACFESTPPITPPGMTSFNGVNVLTLKKSNFGISTSDLRILAATAGPNNNETNPSDQAGPFYYTPGSIDFKMEDCFGFTDKDGDGLIPDNDPDCKFIKSLGYIPMEDCGNSIDDDQNGLTDCNDPSCSFTPKCSGGSFNFAADESDTTAPKVTFQKIDKFHDGAFLMIDTNEPSNASLLFYYNSSGCSILNKTINDLGDPSWTYDDYKPWHDIPIDNFAGNPNKLGYDLTNGTTYFYKYKVCDPSSNCGTSACMNFTTKKAEKNFYFKTKSPSGFEIPNPWGDGDLSYGKQINSSAGKNKNLTINCPTAGYSLKLIGIDAKAAKEIDLQDIVCDASNNIIGMGSTTWNKILSDLSVDSVMITWKTGGSSAAIQHCTEANGTGTCIDVTDYLDCTVTASTVTCKIPLTLGFSSYKLSTSDGTNNNGGGGGGSSSTTTQSECNDLIDNDGDGKIDYPADPGCDNISDLTEADCVEDWFCTSWQPDLCPADGKQTRTCEDWNACGTESLKPSLTKNCVPPTPESKKELEKVDVNQDLQEEITGAATWNKRKILKNSILVAIIIVATALVGLIIYHKVQHNKHRKQSKKTKKKMLNKLKEKHK